MTSFRSFIRATALPILAAGVVAFAIGASKPAMAEVAVSVGTAPFQTASYDHRHRSFGKQHHFRRHHHGKHFARAITRCVKVRRTRFVAHRRALVSVLACRDVFGRFFFLPDSQRVIRYY